MITMKTTSLFPSKTKFNQDGAQLKTKPKHRNINKQTNKQNNNKDYLFFPNDKKVNKQTNRITMKMTSHFSVGDKINSRWCSTQTQLNYRKVNKQTNMITMKLTSPFS